MQNSIKRNVLQQSVDDLIKQLKTYDHLPRDMLLNIIELSVATLRSQPNVLSLYSPIKVVGDIHGQFYDLLNIFDKFGMPPQTKYLFLGDYVDRGMFCVEVITLLLLLKVKYPGSIYLLRGNHETKAMALNFNFRQQCLIKYDNFVFEEFLYAFKSLPLCAVINRSYFAVHAGLSPQLKNLKDLQKIERNVQPSQKSVLNDILWSDPTDDYNKIWTPNVTRSCSYYFSPYHSKKFLDQENLKMILRGHQVQQQGFKIQTNRQKTENLTMTVFSAPNYCGIYRNQGAILFIDQTSELHIQKFKDVEVPIVLPDYQNVLTWSMPFLTRTVNKIITRLLDLAPAEKNSKRKRNALFFLAEDSGGGSSENTKMQKLENIKRIQQLVFFEKILAESLQRKNKQLQSIHFQTESTLKLTVEEFLDLKVNDQLEKKSLRVRDQNFGPKIVSSRIHSLKYEESVLDSDPHPEME